MNGSVAAKDSFGRALKYLRVSVTDRCNLRCRYCFVDDNSNLFTNNDKLSGEDIGFIVSCFASLGVSRVRITGGEPLVRSDILSIVSEINSIPNINEIMLTTNGIMLKSMAQKLYESGVSRLNISLDSLRANRFQYITGYDKFSDVAGGIKLASAAGFDQIKVNAVIIRGFNDDEVVDFANFAAEHNIIVRFIEFMPVGNIDEWKSQNIVSGEEIIDKLAKLAPTQMQKDANAGPAVNYKLSNGASVGIIAPMTRHFCNECDKLRLTSDGKIRPCLLSDNEISLQDAAKSRDTKLIQKIILDALNAKAKEHEIKAEACNEKFKRTMSKIGG